ncbi:MAG: hypothetical protein CM15mV128_320 [Caudoviricetes sp.]|nr:MAG: hypothetical protein CM15mV128_320 [Caudoviricetes sp.]
MKESHFPNKYLPNFPGKNEEDEEKFKNLIQTKQETQKSELSKIDEELKKLGLK